KLADTIRANPKPVDIAMVHDPASAGPLAGTCPGGLAGDPHKRGGYRLGPVPPENSPRKERTLAMVEGSTGGAGLRGLEQTEPLPLALSVLYFDSAHMLQAYDDIRISGTGQTGVT